MSFLTWNPNEVDSLDPEVVKNSRQTTPDEVPRNKRVVKTGRHLHLPYPRYSVSFESPLHSTVNVYLWYPWDMTHNPQYLSHYRSQRPEEEEGGRTQGLNSFRQNVLTSLLIFVVRPFISSLSERGKVTSEAQTLSGFDTLPFSRCKLTSKLKNENDVGRKITDFTHHNPVSH